MGGRANGGEAEFSLLEVFRVLMSKWAYIVICGVLMAAIVGVGTSVLVPKKYTAYTSMYVYANPKSSEAGAISSADLSAADNLIRTYQVIIKSNTVLDAVAEKLNQEHPEYAEFGITPYMLSDMTSVNVPYGTKLLQVNVKTEDPLLSADIANTFAKYVPEEIVRITKAGGAEIVDYAVVPSRPSSPNLLKFTAVGLLTGLVLSVGFFLLRTYLDTAIYSSEDITKITDCPVIGVIPNIVVGSESVTAWDTKVKEKIVRG